MKVKMIFLVLVLFIGVLWADGSGNGTSTVNLFDRVRNCPAVSTEREGNSNSIYVSTFGLSPSYADTIRGIPGSLHKIDILNGLLTVIFNFESIEFDEDYDHLHAYDAYDQDFIETDSVVCDEAQYRIGGQNGFWSSPVLNEEHNLLYLLTKAGMLFTVDIEQMEVTGNYYNLRAVEKGNPNQNLEINRYEYLATPLLCRETSGDYLIIPGIWHTFKITLSDGLLYSYNLINDISLPLLGEDRFIASAAMDYESPPNLVVISKEGRLFRKKGATVYSNYLPDNPTQCYFQPVINEDGHFYINTEDSVYRIPVDGRISVGAWANDFEIELVADITDLENIEVSGMGKEIIVTRNVDDYNQLIPEYDTYISTGLEDIINHSNELYYQGNLVNAYRLMNNHSIYIQKEQESNCLFSLNNYTYSQDPPFSNENYYVGEIPSVSRLYWEFIKPPDIPNQCSCGYFQYQNWNHLSYATPVLYYTVENRVNVLVFDEQGCVGTWIRSPSESQLGFSPLYYNGEEYYPLYPEQGYSKFMDTPPNVIEFSTIDSINIHYLCEQETDYSIYLNSYAREAVIDTFATANFERLMKHPKYTLSVFDGDTLVYRNDNFRLLDENIHDYYIIGDDTLNVTVGMDTTITNPGGDPNGVIVFNTINVFRGGILRIAGNANVQTTNLNIEEGGLLETTGTMAAEELKLLEVPGCNQPAKILASGYVYADIMEMEDEVEAEFTGYGGNASYDHNINVNNLRDTGYELNSILTVSHTNSAYSDHDVYIAGDKARFSLIVDGDLKTGNLDLFTSGYNIHTTAGNDVQMQITGSGSLCSIGSSLFRRDIEIVKGGLWENESGRIRISNNTDSLFTIHNYGRIDLQDDVYLTGNYYDSENDTTYTGGYKLYLYEDSEMYLRGAEICIGADEVYYPNYDGGKVIQEGRAVIQLEDSGFLHITSIDTLGAGHTPTGGILKIDASS
ncbi:MAG: hypothetical protein P9M05_02070, partial [Candidatus Stygibacter australis]|nr:hypothetical protein [Candidatus Stygibacter australis]